MSTIDLVILSSLCQGPKSAYDLQKQVEKRNLSRWVKMGSYTVYKKVIQYEIKGYVVGEKTKNASAPEKTIYTITPQGKEAVKTLMIKYSVSETRVFLDFNAVIVNFALLDKDSARECLTNIKNGIQNTKAQLAESRTAQKNITPLGRAILEQQFMLLETLEKWEENFESELKNSDIIFGGVV